MIDKKQLVKKFLSRALIFLVVWLFLFHGYIKPHTRVNGYLTMSVAHSTMALAALMGYEVEVVSETFAENNTVRCTIYFDEKPAVLVADACNGLELFALYLGFLICFPGSIKPKVVFALAGVPILFLINAIREVALSLNYLHFRSSFDFNHHYTYAIAVYAVVLIMWRYWLNNYSILSDRNEETNS